METNKVVYRIFNGYTNEAMDESYLKESSLPQYASKMVVHSHILNQVTVRIFHHINSGPMECQCYMCKPRTVREVALSIKQAWKNVWFGAVPYLSAMTQVDSVNDRYGYDDGKTLVIYFLSNATTWKGPIAKAIKAELNRYLKNSK